MRALKLRLNKSFGFEGSLENKQTHFYIYFNKDFLLLFAIDLQILPLMPGVTFAAAQKSTDKQKASKCQSKISIAPKAAHSIL